MSMLRPNRRKDRVPDQSYFAYVRSFPCVICWLLEWRRDGKPENNIEALFVLRSQFDAPPQASPTEAAHVGDGSTGVKCDDRDVAPLCGLEHHREGKLSQHKLRKGFWAYWGIDREKLIAELRADFGCQRGVGVLGAREAAL